ncbi:30S ribosomal protein S12 methylthiotransferase RimO [bacterium]|nr:30S ribosomal protein S12 methylthiotransferase RimO [bacterium]
MKKVGLLNFGCSKNLIDSELMLGLLAENGYKITLDENEADIIIINTCAFINDAEKESVDAILETAQTGKKIIVTGCLSQKYKKELKKEIPEISAMLGTGDYSKIVETIKKLDKEKFVYNICENPSYVYDENIKRQQITVGSSSYIKIADGCNCECGYCIIPKLRGKYKSRPIENIVEEAKTLTEKGVNEIILIAQDTTTYGIDLYGKPSLPKLLKKLEKIENLSWIRIMYAYPTSFNDELIETMKNSKKIVKYIDIPLQHSHPEVLKRMKRPVMDYEKLIKKLREQIPEIAIRTTFIVGYPQETEEEFEHLYNFIKKIKFDRLGVFEFSKEKDTYAYSLSGQISSRIKKSRKNKIMKLQNKISKELNKKMFGKTIPCIVEAITNDDVTILRSQKDAPEIDCLVYAKSEDSPVPGEIVNVKITDFDDYDLFGEIV